MSIPSLKFAYPTLPMFSFKQINLKHFNTLHTHKGMHYIMYIFFIFLFLFSLFYIFSFEDKAIGRMCRVGGGVGKDASVRDIHGMGKVSVPHI